MQHAKVGSLNIHVLISWFYHKKWTQNYCEKDVVGNCKEFGMKYCVYHCKTCDGATGSQWKGTKCLLIYEDDSISGWGEFGL